MLEGSLVFTAEPQRTLRGTFFIFPVTSRRRSYGLAGRPES